MSFHSLSISNGATRLPAFADWLCKLGCTDVTYNVSQGFNFNLGIAPEEEQRSKRMEGPPTCLRVEDRGGLSKAFRLHHGE